MEFTVHGIRYRTGSFGELRQVDPKPFCYDEAYSKGYDRPKYVERSDHLQALRLGFVLGVSGVGMMKLLDVGYGNGAFLKYARQYVPEVFGFDVTGLKLQGIETFTQIPEAMKFSMVTMFDVLEHIADPSFLGSLSAEYLVVSTPYCPIRALGVEWFSQKYRHRKPDEHVVHFDSHSLICMMRAYGWVHVATSFHEDIVRVQHDSPTMNILSAGFRRIH